MSDRDEPTPEPNEHAGDALERTRRWTPEDLDALVAAYALCRRINERLDAEQAQ